MERLLTTSLHYPQCSFGNLFKRADTELGGLNLEGAKSTPTISFRRQSQNALNVRLWFFRFRKGRCPCTFQTSRLGSVLTCPFHSTTRRWLFTVMIVIISFPPPPFS